MIFPSKQRLIAIALWAYLFLNCGHAQVSPPEPLRTAIEVTSLTDTLAGRQLAVDITATVTAVQTDWDGQFFLQDETGGIWVEYLGSNPPSIGDQLLITGQTHPGAFAPIIAKPKWEIRGKAPLPVAKPVAIDDLVLGVHDGQRIQIEGTVRSAKTNENNLEAVLAIGGHRLDVRAPIESIDTTTSLIGSTVRIRGTTATHYNQSLRHLTGVAVYVVRPTDFEILAAEDQDPFELPVTKMNRVAQYRDGMGANRRIHVRGQITHRGPGSMIFIQDDTAALRIMSEQTQGIAVGQEIDVAGFLEFEKHLPFLNDGVFRNASKAESKIKTAKVPTSEIKQGLHHGEIVTLSGKVLDRTTRPILSANGEPVGEATTWLVQGDNLSFTVEYERVSDISTQSVAPIGSTIEATGVCYSDLDSQARLRSVQILLSEEDGIQIIKMPSWLTPRRLLFGLAILTPLLVLAIAWSLTVSKKNARLKVLVREKQEAQNLLQESNDTLEQKVEERSQQLQVEMSARKEARLQFKAVISERTRLARDLHDTLEQALTGIALQLETANKLFASSAEKAETHVRLARRWLQQSQIELRHSIWDLRSRELEQFDLSQALKQSVRRLADSMDLRMNFETKGDRRSLSEVLEENVLRIGQEAMTNIAKHSQASEVWVSLKFESEKLQLEIRDNGKGFENNPDSTSQENHYGLLGMSERASRINGKLDINSSSQTGTIIRLLAPITNSPAKNHLED